MKWKRALGIIPLTLFFSMLSLAGEPMQVPAADILRQNVLGSFSYGDVSNLVFTMENLWFLVFFPLLYGMYIAGNFQCAAAYVFSRISKRGIWYGKKAAGLLVCDVIYSGAYITILCIISVRQSTMPFDKGAFGQALWLFFFVLLWNLEIALFVNILALRWNILAGFFVGYGCLAGLILLAIEPRAMGINRFINPILIAEFDGGMSPAVFGKLAVNLIYTAVILIAGMITVKNHDILYIEQE